MYIAGDIRCASKRIQTSSVRLFLTGLDKYIGIDFHCTKSFIIVQPLYVIGPVSFDFEGKGRVDVPEGQDLQFMEPIHSQESIENKDTV